MMIFAATFVGDCVRQELMKKNDSNSGSVAGNN